MRGGNDRPRTQHGTENGRTCEDFERGPREEQRSGVNQHEHDRGTHVPAGGHQAGGYQESQGRGPQGLFPVQDLVALFGELRRKPYAQGQLGCLGGLHGHTTQIQPVAVTVHFLTDGREHQEQKKYAESPQAPGELAVDPGRHEGQANHCNEARYAEHGLALEQEVGGAVLGNCFNGRCREHHHHADRGEHEHRPGERPVGMEQRPVDQLVPQVTQFRGQGTISPVAGPHHTHVVLTHTGPRLCSACGSNHGAIDHGGVTRGVGTPARMFRHQSPSSSRTLFMKASPRSA